MKLRGGLSEVITSGACRSSCRLFRNAGSQLTGKRHPTFGVTKGFVRIRCNGS